MNPHLERRLQAILDQLKAVREGHGASSSTRGAEREQFVELLLKGCVPMPYRFGSGEITDAHGNVSGQLDVVIEHPFFASFPLLGTDRHRLYLIESVAIAIEVKSSRDKFGEAVDTMKKVRALKPDADWPRERTPPRFGLMSEVTVGSLVPSSFPGRTGFAIVMYRGFRRAETLANRCIADDVDLALQFDPPVLYAKNFRETGASKVVTGIGALAAFVFLVTDELLTVSARSSDLLRRYVEQLPPPGIK